MLFIYNTYYLQFNNWKKVLWKNSMPILFNFMFCSGHDACLQKSQLKSFIQDTFGYLLAGIALKEIAGYLFQAWLIRIYVCKNFIDLRVNGTSGRNFAWANTAESGHKWINLVPICNIDWQSSKMNMQFERSLVSKCKAELLVISPSNIRRNVNLLLRGKTFSIIEYIYPVIAQVL